MIDEEDLPQKYWIYKKSFQPISQTKRLFRTLFLNYKICIKCILRIYGIQQPKLYSDSEFFIQILPKITDLTTEQLLKLNYKSSQTCLLQICWLCQQIFQKSYLSRLTNQITSIIKQKGFQNWQQFKLNIRVPNIITLRSIILCRYIFWKIKSQEKDQFIIKQMYNILVHPLQSHNKVVDPKTVLKWLLSNQLNQNTNMTSTADEHPDNLIISIEYDSNDLESQSTIMNHFRTFLGLQKKKQKSKGKKICLDLGLQKQVQKQDYRCNANNLNKITGMKQIDFQVIFEKIKSIDQFWMFINGNQTNTNLSISNVTHKIQIMTKNVYLCGRYIKFSRYLSQTPWMVNGKKLTQGSLQQQIQDKIYKLFYPNKNKQQVQIKFHSGGRQDIDVRMLKGGRPFVLQFVNPIKSINLINQNEVFQLCPQHSVQKIKKQYQQWQQQYSGNGKQMHSWRIVKLLQLIINYQNMYVQVLDLQQTTQSYISVQLKAAESEKVKHYLCYIYSIQTLQLSDKILLQNLKNIKINQLTPLRVLHRRTLMNRDKIVHRLKMHTVSQHSAVLQVWASAGTYIKQFVHGDLGRTLPNIGQILKKQVDILQLDVGSLKQGQWVQGDEQKMKLDEMQWMQ